MTNEWVEVELMGANRDGEPITYTIAEGTSVSKGQLLKLADNRTVTATTLFCPIAGVAHEEHVGGLGVTRIAVETNGIYRATSSDAIAIGDPLTAAGAASNLVTASYGAASEASNAITIIRDYGALKAFDAVATNTALTVRLLI